MSVAGLKKQFYKASQLVSEKVGGAEGTKLDDDFKEMEKVMGERTCPMAGPEHSGPQGSWGRSGWVAGLPQLWAGSGGDTAQPPARRERDPEAAGGSHVDAEAGRELDSLRAVQGLLVWPQAPSWF